MCTALSLKTREHYFGRTLDIDRSYGEEVCVMPRNFPLEFRCAGENARPLQMNHHYAMIGMATVVGQTPLFYEAANEHGLAMAGLNFPGNAHYAPLDEGKDNIAPFEFIPWLLGQCKSVEEAKNLLDRINLADISFNQYLPHSPLHWMIADRDGSIVVEAMSDGLHIYHNPTGVMTNNPPFPVQLLNLNSYRNLRVDNGDNVFAGSVPVNGYCQGLGAIGLPGDVSSMSRFVRIAFGRANSVCAEEEASSVGQFFHLLSSVEMNRGLCLTTEKTWDITVYTACINTDRGLYYYTTYDNRQIHCIDMHKTDLDSSAISRFKLVNTEQICYQN